MGTGKYFEGYYIFRINTNCFISVSMEKSMAWKENIIPLISENYHEKLSQRKRW
jgi:hypothetical protein